MKILFFKTINRAETISRIEGLILREGETAAPVPGSSNWVAMAVSDPERTRGEIEAEGFDGKFQ